MAGAAPLTRAELRRYGRHLVAARDRCRRAGAAEGGAGAARRRRRAGLSGGALSRRGRGRHPRRGRVRRRRRDQPAAPDPVRRARRRPREARRGGRAARRHQPARRGSSGIRRASTSTTRSSSSAPTTWCVDGSDNFPTRYLVNDACVLAGKPDVYGAIFRFEGQALGLRRPRRSLLPLPLPRAAAAGTRAVVRRGRACSASCPGSSASIQANEAIKWIARRRRAARRPAAALRRPGAAAFARCASRRAPTARSARSVRRSSGWCATTTACAPAERRDSRSAPRSSPAGSRRASRSSSARRAARRTSCGSRAFAGRALAFRSTSSRRGWKSCRATARWSWPLPRRPALGAAAADFLRQRGLPPRPQPRRRHRRLEPRRRSRRGALLRVAGEAGGRPGAGRTRGGLRP